jgi:heme-degrading monooxygenase HmoA
VGEANAEVTVVSVLRLSVAPGAEEQIVEVYARLEIFERSRESGGFRGARLLRPQGAGEPFLVVAEWDDAAAYERWLGNPVRAELGEQLAPLIAGPPAAGALYEEALRG